MNYMSVVADQREIGQHEPAGSFLRSAFFGPTFDDRADGKQQLEMLAAILRRFSDNFVPESFDKRDIKDKHPDCLEILLKGNVKAVTRFSAHFQTMTEQGLLDTGEIMVCTKFLNEEKQRLVDAAILFDTWKRTYVPTSQPVRDPA